MLGERFLDHFFNHESQKTIKNHFIFSNWSVLHGYFVLRSTQVWSPCHLWCLALWEASSLGMPPSGCSRPSTISGWIFQDLKTYQDTQRCHAFCLVLVGFWLLLVGFGERFYVTKNLQKAWHLWVSWYKTQISDMSKPSKRTLKSPPKAQISNMEEIKFELQSSPSASLPWQCPHASWPSLASQLPPRCCVSFSLKAYQSPRHLDPLSLAVFFPKPLP